jgi:glucose/arabinose dehydrogenase
MKTMLSLAMCLIGAATLLAVDTPQTWVSGLKNPESVCVGPEGVLYVTEIGEPGKNGDGKVTKIVNGQAEAFAEGLDDPKGIIFHKDAFYLTDKTKLIRVDLKGQVLVYKDADTFPQPPIFLNDIAIDGPSGILLVSDSGKDGKGGAVFRIDMRLSKIETVASGETIPGLTKPNGVTFDGASFMLLADMGAGNLYRVSLLNKEATKIASGLEGADGLVWDPFGRLYITSWTTGKTFVIPRPGQQPILIGEGLKSAADSCWDTLGNQLLIPDMKSGTLTKWSGKIPGWEVDETPIPLAYEQAFPKLKWTGWDDGSDSGKVVPLRPIVMTHANDGTNFNYVAIQQGTIHRFENSDQAEKTSIFLDISKQVKYSDRFNEEGLLGLAFHPQFKTNGEFFVFYTGQEATGNVVSRFRVKKNDPTVADPASEERLLRIEKLYFNHDGGTIFFGADGYLYIAHGDGGDGGDPHENGQNLKTMLGKVLRIDVNKKSADKPYAIPADNPFIKNTNALPEIWAYGLRNPWRMAFDSQSEQVWLADVGQGLYEEINLVKAGGNYGWNVREGLHPFGKKGVANKPELIDPIWEYHHNLGVSITGGAVYRGQAIPELRGMYLYGDYVSGRMWALQYDAKLGRVVANRPFKGSGLSLMSFGEDTRGEAYVMGATPDARSIYRIIKAKE